MKSKCFLSRNAVHWRASEHVSHKDSKTLSLHTLHRGSRSSSWKRQGEGDWVVGVFHLALENKGQAGRKSSRVRISRGTSSLSLRKKQGDLPKSMRMCLEHTAPYWKGSRKPIFERTRTESILVSREAPQGTQHRQSNKDVHKHECSNKLPRLGDAGGWLEYDDNFSEHLAQLK